MATSSYFGRNSFVGAAVEVTYGTAITVPTVYRPIISCSMLRQVEKVERPNLRVAGTAGLRKGHFIASDKATGALSIEATYDNIGFFLRHAFGDNTTTVSGTPNSHAYELGEPGDKGVTLMLQRGTGTNYEAFEGVVINSLTMGCAAGEIMTVDMDLIAETSGTRTGSGPALTFSDPTNENLVLHHHTTAAGLAWNSTNINLIDFEFKLENGLSDRMRLGSKLTKQPTASDYRVVTMTVSFETDDATYASFLSDVTGQDAVVIFNNGASSGDEREIKFSLNAAYIDSFTDEVSETGLVTASVTFKGEADGTGGLPLGAQIIVKNEAATAVHKG